MNLKGFKFHQFHKHYRIQKAHEILYQYKAVDNSNNDPYRIYISCLFKCVLTILSFVNELFTKQPSSLNNDKVKNCTTLNTALEMRTNYKT